MLNRIIGSIVIVVSVVGLVFTPVSYTHLHHGIHFLISIHQFVRLEFFSVVSVDAVVGKKPHVTFG